MYTNIYIYIYINKKYNDNKNTKPIQTRTGQGKKL